MGQSRGEAGRSTVPNSRNRPAGSGVPAPYASFIAWLRSLTSTVRPRSPGAALRAAWARASASSRKGQLEGLRRRGSFKECAYGRH